MLWKEEINEKLLFHSSKMEIEGIIDVNKGRTNNDFGKGFMLVKIMNKQFHTYLTIIVRLFILFLLIVVF